MEFKVVKPSRLRVTLSMPGGSGFVLEQDEWNDFSFQTLYHLHYVKDKSNIYIGPVKILKKGQTKSDPILIQNDFESLNEDFVSLGQSLDYYQHLSELGLDIRETVLSALRDLVKFPELEPKFSAEGGWDVSLFRYVDKSEFFPLARALLDSDYTSIPSENLKFSFSMTGWQQPVTFDFSPPNITDRRWNNIPSPLPGSMFVLIGKNGSGKSTFLARLARVAYASNKNRDLDSLLGLGTIEPKGIGFPKIVTVSYSAFDGFQLPGISSDERRQIIKDVDIGSGRFIFCGLRDIAKELEDSLKQEENTSGKNFDRLDSTLLKPLKKLAEEFSRTIHRLYTTSSQKDFLEAVAILNSESSFTDIANIFGEKEPSDEDLIKMFMSWSTGHKIVMHIIANLVANVVPRSLVLIDEPEAHLHPPLLAALMHAVRHILKKRHAFSIVATHSSIVLQETMARHIVIVRREGTHTDTQASRIETFGESVGA